jgi:hypothetical protein
LIIAFWGPAGVGKTTAADISYEIARSNAFKATYVNFADPIYDMVGSLLYDLYSDEIPHELCRVNKEIPLQKLSRLLNKRVCMRDLLTTLGTEWGRNLISPELWIALYRDKVHKAFKEYDVVITSDVRFTNEKELILENYDSVLIKIDRELDKTVDHSSEYMASGNIGHRYVGKEFLISNNTTMEDLRSNLELIIEPLFSEEEVWS